MISESNKFPKCSVEAFDMLRFSILLLLDPGLLLQSHISEKNGAFERTVNSGKITQCWTKGSSCKIDHQLGSGRDRNFTYENRETKMTSNPKEERKDAGVDLKYLSSRFSQMSLSV